MSISSCPQCGKQVTIPAGVGTSAKVRCPLCHSHYTLADALVNMPPLLELVDEDIEDSLDTQPSIPGGLTVADAPELPEEPAPEVIDELESEIDFGESDINALGDLEEPADEEASLDDLELDAPLDLESTTDNVAPKDHETAHDLDDLTVEIKDTEIEEISVSDEAPANDAAEEQIAFAAESAGEDILDFGAESSAEEPADMAAASDEGNEDEVALDFGGAPTSEGDDAAPIEFDDELTASSESGDGPTIDFGEAAVAEGAADADEMALDFGQPVEMEEPAVGGEADAVEAVEEPEETDKKGKKKKKKKKKVKAAADGEPRPKRKMSGVLSATLGGLLGLMFALYGMMWLGPDYDFLGLGKMLPGFMVPSSVNKPTYVATQKPSLDMPPPAAIPPEPMPDQPVSAEPLANDSATLEAAADVPAEPTADVPAEAMPADEAPADTAPIDSAPADTAPADDPFAPAATEPDLASEAPVEAPGAMPADDSTPAIPKPETSASTPPSQPEFPPAADEPAAEPSADPFAPSEAPATDATADPFAPSDMPAEPAAEEAPAPDAVTDAPPSAEPDVPATTTPAPPIAEPPAAEMPVAADDPFAESTTTPGATDDPFADSPVETEAPAEPAPEPVGPLDVAKVSPQALALAIQAAEAADQQMVAAQGTAAEAELKRIRSNFYVSLFRMADGATFAKDDAQSGQLDVMRQEMDRFVRQLTTDPKRYESLKYNAGRWLGFPRRTTPGIILAGKVQSVEPVGKLHEIKLNIGLENAEESIVSVLSATDPGVNDGDNAVVLGTIVENPAQALAGYEGSDPTVVWNGMLLNLSTQ